jgi:hypothetical protein
MSMFIASEKSLLDFAFSYCSGTQTAQAFEPFERYKTNEEMRALLKEVKLTDAFSEVGLSPGGQKQSHTSHPLWSRLKSDKTGTFEGFRVELVRGALRRTGDDIILQTDLLYCKHWISKMVPGYDDDDGLVSPVSTI